MRKEPRSKRRTTTTTPKAETPTQPDATPQAEQPAPTSASEPAAPTPERLAVLLDTDGRIEIESMRSATKDKLKTALQDPTLLTRLGITAGGVSIQPDTLFDTNVCTILYVAVGQIMAAIAVKAGGYPVDQVLAVVPFTAEEIGTLAPLTGKVLDKWIPMSGKYKDEAMLGLALFGIVQGKFSQLKRPAMIHPFRVGSNEVPPEPDRVVPPAERPS